MGTVPVTDRQRKFLEGLPDFYGQEGISIPHYLPAVIRQLRDLKDAGEPLSQDAAFEFAQESGWKPENAHDLATIAAVVRYWDGYPG